MLLDLRCETKQSNLFSFCLIFFSSIFISSSFLFGLYFNFFNQSVFFHYHSMHHLSSIFASKFCFLLVLITGKSSVRK